MKAELESFVGLPISDHWISETHATSSVELLEHLVETPLDIAVDPNTAPQIRTVEINEDFFVSSLDQNLLLEIKDAVNVARKVEDQYRNSDKRCLKLILTNGADEFIGFEETMLDLKLTDLTKLRGAKIFLRQGLEIRRSILVFRREFAEFILGREDAHKILTGATKPMMVEQSMPMPNNTNPEFDFSEYMEYFQDEQN